jgi:hypothetical protein
LDTGAQLTILFFGAGKTSILALRCTLMHRRSIQNIRIERLWRDVRAGTLEAFRCLFIQMTENNLYDPNNPIHKLALHLVYQKRIQHSLQDTLGAWNNHKLRTEHYRTPEAIYALSRQQAILNGTWLGNVGDPLSEVNSATYGVETCGPHPPPEEVAAESNSYQSEGQDDVDHPFEESLVEARQLLQGFDFGQQDDSCGTELFAEVVLRLSHQGRYGH